MVSTWLDRCCRPLLFLPLLLGVAVLVSLWFAERGLLETAPRIRAWVLDHYEVRAEGKFYLLFTHRGETERSEPGEPRS